MSHESADGRPFVRLNVAAGVDGKIAPIGGGKVNFGSAEDRSLMEQLRAEADAVLIGVGTLLAEDPPLIIRDQARRSERLAAKGSAQPLNVTVTTTLPDGLASMEFFREPTTEKLIFTTARTPSSVLESAAILARVEVVPLDRGGQVDLVEVLRRLKSSGVSHLLLEGGGELNFSMIEADLIDEIYVTVCPFVFGGRTAPTPFDGAGFTRDHVRKLALKDHRIGSRGEVFLRYDVLPGSPTVTASGLFPKGFEISY